MPAKKLSKADLKLKQEQELKNNLITTEWVLRETATVEDGIITLKDKMQVIWTETGKYHQLFTVKDGDVTYIYRYLDAMVEGIREIRESKING